MIYKFKNTERGGQLSLQVIFFAVIVLVLVSGFTFAALSFLKLSVREFNRSLAFSAAEAGIEYYRWHLAHDADDYWDGRGPTSTGPYVHDYYDKSGVKIGSFSLEITPPLPGSTIVTIESTGRVLADSSVKKVIRVKMGVPSFAKFAVAANDTMRFGEGTEVFGEIFSNGGIRFDGKAHNIIRSAVPDYNDPDHAGNIEFGVHTHVIPPPGSGVDDNFIADEAPPTSPVPLRPDVFGAGREFPVPALDFGGLTQDLAEIRAEASSSGYYFGAATSGLGYHVVLKTDDTFDLYEVTRLFPRPNGCIEVLGQKDWGTWSIDDGGEIFLGNYSFPQNNLIFFEDDIWVDGQIDEARITIVAGRFPENSATYAHITINKDLLYTNYDGTDVIGLIAQGNINAGMVSEDDLRIDAALVAQNNRIGRYYYRPPRLNQNRCAPYHIRDTITLYGTIITHDRYGFAYSDGTGYQNRNLIYDPNLLYTPPPSFPLTTDNYEMISWEEVQ